MIRRTAAQHACTAAVTAALLLTGCGRGAPSAAHPPAPGGTPAAGDKRCPALDLTARSAEPAGTAQSEGGTPEGARLSAAIGQQGYGAFADVYATQITDQPPGRVVLCVTDLARGRKLLEAAHSADPEADPGRADLYLSPYTHRRLMAAVDQAMRLKDRFPAYAGHASSGATGVTLVTSAEGAASKEYKARLEKATGGIPVTLEAGDPVGSLVGDRLTRPPVPPTRP
ncbi:hypothetical protein AB0I68_12115 [Streptomyces sp. NPDC050448]|uniref:hypothetical protein n=1 Tax=Streptomyces sp. NPDC050448 TaxID=3155404 RepID=UPI00341B0FDC